MQLAVSVESTRGSPRLPGEIVGFLREPFAMLDGDLRLIEGSQAFFLRFGLARSESIGRCVFDLGAGEWDTPGAHDLLERLAPRRDRVEGYSLEVRFPGAPQPYVQVSVRPVREGRNRISHYLLDFADAPAPVSASAGDLLHQDAQRTGEFVAVLDGRSLRFRRVEGGAPAITGHTAGELDSLPIATLLHPAERPGVLASLLTLGSDRPRLRTTFRVRHRDGRYLWVEALCHAARGPDGAHLIHLVGRDVSERTRAEEALRWLSRQTKLILDSAADGIFGVDPSGNITFINPAAARALGYRVPELLGRGYHALCGPSGLDEEAGQRDIIALTLRDGVARRVRDGTLACGDGSGIAVELTCSPAREHGVVTGAVVVFRDISERKKAEAAALRAEWLAGVGETTLAVRHEINNPLITLLAEARLLEMGGNTPEEELQMVSAICGEARRIAAVIRRLAERQDEPEVRLDGTHRMLDLSA